MGWVRLAALLLVVGCVDLARPVGLSQRDAGRDAPALVDTGSDVVDPPGTPDAAPFTVDGAAGDEADADGADAPGDEPVGTPLLADGEPCTSASVCTSGICADGVCCHSSCSGPCQRCDLESARGSCAPIPAGQDPDGECAADAPATCGLDGTCDGAGGCRRYAQGTECAPGSCVGGTEVSASTCNGSGACAPGRTRACAPNVCAAGVCSETCAGPTDCQPSSFCDSGHCQPKRPLADACTSASQCTSGFCADGVCCNSACGDTCFACNLPGAGGTCTAVSVGADPNAECPSDPISTCGRVGGCDGAGACRRYPSGTTCAPESCTGATLTGASHCTSGACVAPAATSCGRYQCSGTACATSCANSTQCAGTNVCSAGTCLPPCTPESNAAFCARLGKTCGAVVAADNCGGTRALASCGTCSPPQSCGGGGKANVCGAACAVAYAQSSCVGYNLSSHVSSGGHNWSCANGNCANCATNAGCAPGGSGCPWGTVWNDDGPCG